VKSVATNRRRTTAVTATALAAGLPLLLALLYLKPPALIRVGANYTAKIVCSNVFLAHRDPQEVLRTDVQAPGHPLLRAMRVTVDGPNGLVRAGLFGFIGEGMAVYRGANGCTVLPDGIVPSPTAAIESVSDTGSGAALANELWPDGDAVELDESVNGILADTALAGPGMRTIVVVHQGRIVAERYADGFTPATRQLGWSMAKSVTAGLVGVLVQDGRLTLTMRAGKFLHWAENDPRSQITLADLMAMSSGLQFNEGYGAVSDVTRMLYLEPDMANFAASRPLQHTVGSVWSYSSGSAVLVSRIAADAAGTDTAGGAAGVVSRRLFQPLGMTSAVMESDERGTLVGSSYLYATPRDWARYGQLLAQDGIWQGREFLPRNYVSMMAEPVAASGGEYGHGLLWRWATHDDQPGENPSAAFGIPPDAFWMLGHDGQSIAVIPSRQLVIVRLGLTPARLRYHPEPLVEALLKAIR